MNLGRLHIDVGKTLKLKLRSKEGREAVVGYLGQSVTKKVIPTFEETEKCIKVTWRKHATLTIQHTEQGDNHIYDIHWLSVEGESKEFGDAFVLHGSHWYGACQVKVMPWPIEKWTSELSPYLPMDSFQNNLWGGVMERYWLNSNGVAIFVDPLVPLFVSHNNKDDQKITFVSKFEPPYKNTDESVLSLKYTLFLSDNVRNVHDLAAGKVIPKPLGIPDEALFRYPIWSTWAKYKTHVSQDIVMQFADEIKEHGFKAAQLEIDDDWTPKYGDMIFDPEKFPDPQKMVDELKVRGFRVTLWVHPFCSPMSKAFYAGLNAEDYWVSSGPLPGMTKWWNGVGKILDVTNPDAVCWFKGQLKELQAKYGITSFKFDAGELNWMPKWFKFHKEANNPSVYTRTWVELAYDMDKEIRCQEVRVGCQTQHIPVFVRMMDKDSNWGYDNGLKTLIPHVLTHGLIGYPFVLPDMIGGNSYPIGKEMFPEKELFIRWLQANVFMPSLQYSITPWQYDEEVVAIARKMTELHEQYADKFIELARECTKTGAPINRPLWWIAPEDLEALKIDNEFLVGDDILVCPVLESGARKRDIYLPSGTWKDELRGGDVSGGQWVRDYKAELADLPYFTRVTEA